MPILKEQKWQKLVDINKDAYGKCCVDVAREVMKILDAKIHIVEARYGMIDTYKLICLADDNVKGGGITGFMAGCVAQMVSEVHSRGEEFRKQWNKDNGIKEDRGGVVNPAILTLKEK